MSELVMAVGTWFLSGLVSGLVVGIVRESLQ